MTVNAFGIDQEPFIGESFCIYDSEEAMLAELRVMRHKMSNILKEKDNHEHQLVESVESVNNLYEKLIGNISKIITTLLKPSVGSNSNTDSAVPNYRFSFTGAYASNKVTIRYDFKDAKMSRYLGAIAIMLCLNDTNKLPQMLVDNFDTMLSQTELALLLEYISRQLKQYIIILSKENHKTTSANNETFWLYRNSLVCICN